MPINFVGQKCFHTHTRTHARASLGGLGSSAGSTSGRLSGLNCGCHLWILSGGMLSGGLREDRNAYGSVCVLESIVYIGEKASSKVTMNQSIWSTDLTTYQQSTAVLLST